MSDEPVEQFEMMWNGVQIQVTYKPLYWEVTSHIELRTVSPAGAHLPVTDTGYRSHFIPPGTVEAFEDGAEAFVRAWLDEAAQDPKWQRERQQRMQLDLL